MGLGRLEKSEEVSVGLAGQGGAVPAITKQSIDPNTAVMIMIKSRGRILGRNPDESLNSFPPCYSQSPLQLMQYLTISAVQLGGGSSKSDRKAHPLPYGLRKFI